MFGIERERESRVQAAIDQSVISLAASQSDRMVQLDHEELARDHHFRVEGKIEAAGVGI